MNAAKRKSRSRKSSPPATRVRARSDVPTGDFWNRSPSSLLAASAVALFVARLLIPTEAADQGESLWITQCWLLLAVAWVVDAFRRGKLHLRFDRLDVAVGVLVAGHLVSGIAVLVGTGNKRLALNMLWEWVGLGVSFVLLRQLLQSRGDVRRFLWMTASVVGVLAAFGLWQHYVMLPAEAERFQRTEQRLDQLRNEAGASSLQEYRERQREIKLLQLELPVESLNPDGTIRKAFKFRLLASKEPFGQFALANTFAGLLAVGLIPLLAVFVASVRARRGWPAILGAAVVAAVIAYCLLLTKSRTAWVGAAAGITVWLWLSRRKNDSGGTRLLAWGGAGVVVILAIVVIAAATGGIDRKTLSESPKSLRYRLQYWTGTASVLRDQPILGTGPGNFRQHYLRYKAPEASEEIRDPHNLILEAWTSGGLIALAGLFGVVVIGFTSLRRFSADEQTTATGDDDTGDVNEPEPAYSSVVWIVGSAAGFLLVYLANQAFYQQWDSSLLVLMAGCLLTQWLLSGVFLSSRVTAASIAGAWVTLLVHLLGAGGMEYPAIVQILLIAPALLWALRTCREPAAARTYDDAVSSNRSLVWVWLAAMGTLCGLCMLTAVKQVHLRRWLMLAGQAEWRERGKTDEAARNFAAAAAADPFSPEPNARLAQVLYLKWRNGGRDPKTFEDAVHAQKLSIQLDPNSSSRYRVLGEWYAEKYADSRKREDAESAIHWYRESLSRYPNHSATVAELSVFLSSVEGATDDAAETAGRAIQLDDINQAAGHLDRILPKPLRNRLEQIHQRSSEAMSK